MTSTLRMELGGPVSKSNLKLQMDVDVRNKYLKTVEIENILKIS